MCGEKQRFEKLMEHFRNEDNNIDFMVSPQTPEAFPAPSLPASGRAAAAGSWAGLVAKISHIWGFKVFAGVGEIPV